MTTASQGGSGERPSSTKTQSLLKPCPSSCPAHFTDPDRSSRTIPKMGRTTTTVVVSMTLLGLVAGGFYCPMGWHMGGESCFYFSTEARTWHQSLDYCRANKANLVSILDEQKNKYISAFSSSSLWTGLRATVVQDATLGPFRWIGISDTQLNYTKWAREEPNRGIQSCAFMYRYRQGAYGRWNDYYCRKLYPYFCEKELVGAECPSGWSLYNGKCYHVNGTPADWFTARSNCQDGGADLVVIDNQEENTWLKGRMAGDRNWIGLWDPHMDQHWRWLDQPIETTWLNWNKGEPQNNNNAPERCGAMFGMSYRRGRWKSVPCRAYYQYICEREPVNNTCVSPWRSRTSSTTVLSCYLISTELASWTGARKACQAQEADLMAIETSTELYWIKRYIRGSYDHDCYWIGITDHFKKGTWAWLDRQTRATYTYWYSSEPRGPESNDCVMVHSTEHNRGKWTNVKCSVYMGYVCEISDSSCIGNGSHPLTFGGHCYSMEPATAASWTYARSRCGRQGPTSDLVVIETQEEMNFITNLIAGRTTVIGFWVGLNARDRPSQFHWLDLNLTTTYTNWAGGQQQTRSMEDCVKMSSGSWYDESCLNRYQFVCEKPRLGQRTFYDFSIGNTVYKVVNDRTFPRAADFRLLCTNVLGTGADLATIDSVPDFRRIGVELSLRNENTGTRQYWIGNVTDQVQSPRLIAGECMYLDTLFPAKPRLSTSFCCQPKAALCKKHVEKGDEEFDFLFNNTIYKFVTEKKNQTEAEAVCARLLSDKLGQGTLMRVTSDAERGMVSAEIRARHLGKDLRYWIGNGTTQAESGDVTQTPVTACRVLSYKSYPDAVWDTLHLDVLRENCSKLNKFVCQKVLPPSETQVDRAVYEEVVNKITETAKVIDDEGLRPMLPQSSSGGCAAPCIVLAICIPIAAVIFFLMGVTIATACYRCRSSAGWLPFV